MKPRETGPPASVKLREILRWPKNKSGLIEFDVWLERGSYGQFPITRLTQVSTRILNSRSPMEHTTVCFMSNIALAAR